MLGLAIKIGWVFGLGWQTWASHIIFPMSDRLVVWVHGNPNPWNSNPYWVTASLWCFTFNMSIWLQPWVTIVHSSWTVTVWNLALTLNMTEDVQSKFKHMRASRSLTSLGTLIKLTLCFRYDLVQYLKADELSDTGLPFPATFTMTAEL